MLVAAGQQITTLRRPPGGSFLPNEVMTSRTSHVHFILRALAFRKFLMSNFFAVVVVVVVVVV
jgi:hypothetical protein